MLTLTRARSRHRQRLLLLHLTSVAPSAADAMAGQMGNAPLYSSCLRLVRIRTYDNPRC